MRAFGSLFVGLICGESFGFDVGASQFACLGLPLAGGGGVGVDVAGESLDVGLIVFVCDLTV
jgi:hypothetical protein